MGLLSCDFLFYYDTILHHLLYSYSSWCNINLSLHHAFLLNCNISVHLPASSNKFCCPESCLSESILIKPRCFESNYYYSVLTCLGAASSEATATFSQPWQRVCGGEFSKGSAKKFKVVLCISGPILLYVSFA